jgi:gas vesicle protein
MNKLTQFIKSIRFRQIIVVFLAGFLLIINTACTSPNSTDVSRKASYNNTQAKAVTNQDPDYDYYDANQPKEGGMNKYNDDPRWENSDVRAKARNLSEGAKANVNRSFDSPQEISRKAGETVDRLTEDVPERINRFKENAGEAAQERLETTKYNLDKASTNLSRAADNTSDAVQNKVDDTARATRRAVEDGLDRVTNPS